MAITKEQILEKLKEEGITNLDELARKVSERVSDKKMAATAGGQPVAQISAFVTVGGNVLFTT